MTKVENYDFLFIAQIFDFFFIGTVEFDSKFEVLSTEGIHILQIFGGKVPSVTRT